MIVSIWRYSHWILAVVTSLFVLTAAVTGIILAIEPMSNQLKPYAINGSSQISIADLVGSLNAEFKEVVSVEVDDNRFLKTTVFTDAGTSASFYINPVNGKKVAGLIQRAPIYDFATNLHRSLFLKSTGRFLMGLVSFLMVLIAVTGAILIAKRQGGFKRWFTRVVKEDFNQYYHVVIGRYALLPLLIITISGVILSLERFSVFPDSEQKRSFSEPRDHLDQRTVSDFKLFKEHEVSDLVHLEYPFSKDEEDYFILKLKDGEYHINQYTGQVLMTGEQPVFNKVLDWAYVLHTGQGTTIWALILLLSSVSLLFFMFSGFSMGLKRLKRQTHFANIYTENEAEFVLLVGSETGSTFKFARAFFDAAINRGIPVFLDSMNNYQSYRSAKQILVFASTYGDGDAPAGASRFNERFKDATQHQPLNYAVVGFGSDRYPEFCKYAMDTDALIGSTSNFNQLLPAFKINNQSVSEFKEWMQQWNLRSGMNLKIDEASLTSTPKTAETFTVVHKTEPNSDDTFIIQLRPPKAANFKSGDLLVIQPKEDGVERPYSIGKVSGLITLSIKRHEYGLVSNLLDRLKKGDVVEAELRSNTKFHAPPEAELIMISNGTGIAPFLGMSNEQSKEVKSHLFWGGRREDSLELYKSMIDKDSLDSLHLAFSREETNRNYVQDLVLRQSELVAEVLKNNGVIMICGSLKMKDGVMIVLNRICISSLDQSISCFEAKGQILSDCY